jgi:hypothetical protein
VQWLTIQSVTPEDLEQSMRLRGDELSGVEEWHRAVIFDADGPYRGLLVNIVDIIVTYDFPGEEPSVKTVVTFCDGRTFVVNENVRIGDRPEYAGRRWTIEEAHTFMQLDPQGLDFFREDAIAYWCDIELAGEPLSDVGIVYMPS